jgi:hypothetical protein
LDAVLAQTKRRGDRVGAPPIPEHWRSTPSDRPSLDHCDRRSP